jgi:hypothetical protein
LISSPGRSGENGFLVSTGREYPMNAIVREKIYKILHAQLTEAQFDSINISFYTYPCDGSTAMPGSPGDFTFHPDCLEKDRSKNITKIPLMTPLTVMAGKGAY